MFEFQSLNVKEPEDIDYAKQYLSPWSGYFKKSIKERQKSVKNEDNNAGILPLNIADIMIENCIGTLSLPLGISPNFIINNKHFIVPFCVEEPSIIAAASSISKLIAKNGGFSTCNSDKNVMIGQVQILNINTNINNAANIIKQNESKYIQMGNNKYCASMVKRGGGINKIESRIIVPRIYKHNKTQRDKYLVVHIHIDVCDAMGANKVNTVCEGLSTLFLNDLVANGCNTATIGLRILSNLCVTRMTMSIFCIPVANLSWKGFEGMIVARKIVEGYEFAMDDIYRASTNNKGIMNGMDSVATALGQDWRAIESAAHCFAGLDNDNKYGPLAHYFIDYSAKKKCQCLYGYLNVPISVGSKGGSITTHPGYKYTHSVLNMNNNTELTAKDIANVIVSAGLATNFAAIRALAIEGIQRGHMMLHSKNIAVSVLENKEEQYLVNEISQFMVKKKAINTNMANRYVAARKIEFEKKEVIGGGCFPSTLMVEIQSGYGMVELDVVIDTNIMHLINKEMMHLEIKGDNVNNEEKIDEPQLMDDIILKLFGKSSADIAKTYNMMDSLNILCKNDDYEYNNECKSVLLEIKLLALLINTVFTQYLWKHKDNSFILSMCDEIENYILNTYDKPNENKNISIKPAHTNNELESKLFCQCLIKSLLRSLIFRIKIVETKTITENIGHCLLNWQLSSLYSLKYIYELNQQFLKLNVPKTENEIICKWLNNVLLQKANKYPVLIFLFSNILIINKLNDLTKDFIAVIEKCALFLQCNMNLHYDIKNVNDGKQSNIYLLYLQLFEINDSAKHKELFSTLINQKIKEIDVEIQQTMAQNEELQAFFDLNQLIQSLQLIKQTCV